MQKAAIVLIAAFVKKDDPATTYSPTHLRMQYHRLNRA
jgi:hypothetical protein